MNASVPGQIYGLLWLSCFERLDLEPPTRAAVGIEDGCITDIQAAVVHDRSDGVCHRSEWIYFSQAGKLTHLTYPEDLSLAY